MEGKNIIDIAKVSERIRSKLRSNDYLAEYLVGLFEEFSESAKNAGGPIFFFLREDINIALCLDTTSNRQSKKRPNFAVLKFDDFINKGKLQLDLYLGNDFADRHPEMISEYTWLTQRTENGNASKPRWLIDKASMIEQNRSAIAELLKRAYEKKYN